MKPLSILYDDRIFAQQRYGGVSRIFFELIKNLLNKAELHIFLFQGAHINEFPLKDMKEKMAGYLGRKVRYFPHISLLLKPLNRLLSKKFLLGKKIGIYHPTNYSSIVSEWKRSPVVLMVNDMIPELYPHNFRDIKHRLKIKKRCIERADIIIVISNNTKKDLLQYYHVCPDKVRVVYPGVPTGVENRLYNEEAKRSSSRDRYRAYILYVGTRKQGYKNFYNFFNAYGNAAEIAEAFDLVCVGGPDFSQKEREFFKKVNPATTVVHESADEANLAGLYAGAAALVYPSLYEGFGLPPLEAMAFGCPVIAGNVSVMPEVLGEAAAYFDPHRLETLSAAMETVLYNQEIRSRLIKKGREQVKHYSWERMAEEIYRIYQEIQGK